jgi:hypothetical protein
MQTTWRALGLARFIAETFQVKRAGPTRLRQWRQ